MKDGNFTRCSKWPNKRKLKKLSQNCWFVKFTKVRLWAWYHDIPFNFFTSLTVMDIHFSVVSRKYVIVCLKWICFVERVFGFYGLVLVLYRRNGSSSDSPLIIRLCGSSLPNPVFARNNQVTLELVTDPLLVGKGWVRKIDLNSFILW